MKNLLFTNTEIADLCQQLALLLRAGVRICDGLYLLAEEETVRTAVKEAAEQMRLRCMEDVRAAAGLLN